MGEGGQRQKKKDGWQPEIECTSVNKVQDHIYSPGLESGHDTTRLARLLFRVSHETGWNDTECQFCAG